MYALDGGKRMYAFKGESSRATRRLLLAAVAAAALVAPPAAAQAPKNDDWQLLTELGFGYRLSPQWRLRLDTQLLLLQDVSYVRNIQVRPGLEYAFASNWAVVLGYVQNQRQPGTVNSDRGPFQDIAFGFNWDQLQLSVANRLRTEELFFDNGTHLVRTRYRLSLLHPLGDSPWSVLVFDEVFFNLATSPNLFTGYARNHLYGGLVLNINRSVRTSVGYELISFPPQGGSLYQLHQIRLGFAFALI